MKDVGTSKPKKYVNKVRMVLTQEVKVGPKKLFVHRGTESISGFTIMRGMTLFFASTAWWMTSEMYLQMGTKLTSSQNLVFQTGRRLLLSLRNTRAQSHIVKLKIWSSRFQVQCTTRDVGEMLRAGHA